MEGDTTRIEVDQHFAAAPERVWRALTEPALLAAWLMSNDIRPESGWRFRFQSRPVPGWNGLVDCEVLAADAPRLLRYSWRGGSDAREGYGHRLDTIVTWSLSPTADGGTDLRLTHSGFTAADHFARETMGRGWRTGMSGSLARVVRDST